jgi:type I restriction enzyme, S subunit
MSSKMKTTTTKEEVGPALLPKLRFPEFQGTDVWTSELMGDVYSFKSNNSLSRDKLNYVTGSVKNIHYGDIHTKFSSHFDIRKEYVPFINESEEGVVRDEHLCAEGDMIFADASEDMADIGKSIEVVNLNGVLVVSGLHTILARRSEDRIVLGFGGHLFKSGWVRTQIQKEAQGAKVLGISANRIRNIRLPVPNSKAEQQKIAECLSSLDELIAAQARKVDALKTHKKGLMQQIFPREGETQPRLRFPEFRGAGEWEMKPFEDFVVKSFYGTSSSTSPTGKYPVLRMGNMVDGGLDFTNLVYLDLDADSFESFRLEEGDILLNRTNSPALVGKISLFQLKSDCITASYIVTYRLDKKRIVPAFCNSILNTPLYQSLIKSFAKPSVSQANINPTTLKKDLIVPVPSLPEQERIALCLSRLDTLIGAVIQKLEVLKTHKKGLLQQLFPSAEVLTTL